jgi:hypothetical protein
MSILSLNCSNFLCFQPLSIILCFLVWRLFFLFWEFWSQTATRTSNIIIARRAYCVGTSLISLFVRRLSVCRLSSVTLSSGPGFCKRCMPGPPFAFKTGSVWDILQNLTLWKTIRMSHLIIPAEKTEDVVIQDTFLDIQTKIIS